MSRIMRNYVILKLKPRYFNQKKWKFSSNLSIINIFFNESSGTSRKLLLPCHLQNWIISRALCELTKWMNQWMISNQNLTFNFIWIKLFFSSLIHVSVRSSCFYLFVLTLIFISNIYSSTKTHRGEDLPTDWLLVPCTVACREKRMIIQ